MSLGYVIVGRTASLCHLSTVHSVKGVSACSQIATILETIQEY